MSNPTSKPLCIHSGFEKDCPSCQERISEYWRSDESKAWTCITGRICGGAQFMRDGRAEVDRLRAEIEQLQLAVTAAHADRTRELGQMRHDFAGVVEENGKLREALRAADFLAHAFPFSPEHMFYWKAREQVGFCSVCNDPGDQFSHRGGPAVETTPQQTVTGDPK